MSDLRPYELVYAEELSANVKFDEALEIITNYERNNELDLREQLWVFLLRGDVYNNRMQFRESVDAGEHAYQISKELGMVSETISALILKAIILFLGKTDEGLDLLSKADELLNPSIQDLHLTYFKVNMLKSWGYLYKGEIALALDLAIKNLDLIDKIKNKIIKGGFLLLLGCLYPFTGEFDKALEYAMKSLNLYEEIDYQIGIAQVFWVIGVAYYFKGDLINALEFRKKSLSIPEISIFTKINALASMGDIYVEMGELDLALDKFTQAAELTDEESNFMMLLYCLNGIGNIHIMKGEYNKASEYLHHSLMLSQKAGVGLASPIPNFYLFLMNLEMGLNEKATQYLKNLRETGEQNPVYTHYYLLAKAMMLKKKKRSRDRAEAEKILKKMVSDEVIEFRGYISALVTLCDFLLEELYESNDFEIIEELTPLIEQLLVQAKTQNSFSYLAEGKLLQGKLALIQMNLEGAKSLFIQAQQLAESHGLNLLAQKISIEHDNLLDKLDEWENLQKQNAPMAERIKLASVEGVLNRLQGKRAVEPPEIINEEPILLLIMDDSGTTYFNHPFVTNWDHSDLFSSFMSAFNTFMDELFSNSIDRIKVKENTILINPIESFLVCYVIKGQSYPALQKLTRFTEAIRESSEIWQALEKSVKTSEMLELDKPPALKTVIDDIFL